MEKITPLTLRHRLGLEIARKLRQEQIKEHPLRQLFWECTLRCNLHCRHCGSDCKKEAGFADMPLQDFLRVLDQVAERTDPHKVFVILTGGEPLVREDLEVCGRAIYDRGFPWGLVGLGSVRTGDIRPGFPVGPGDERIVPDARPLEPSPSGGIAYGYGQPRRAGGGT